MVPTIYQREGIKVNMNNLDHNPPHVHVHYSEYEAKLEISTGVVMDGKLPPRKLKLAQHVVEENREKLLEMWANRMQPGGIYQIKD